MPTLITCASIWPKPATRPVTRRSGTRMPAGRSIGLTTSPGRSANCWTMPSVPATTSVLSSATSASRERGLGARLLRRQLEVDLRLDRGLAGDRGVDGALGGVDRDLRPFDLALGDGVGVAPHQLGAGARTRRRPAAARRGPGRSCPRPRRAATSRPAWSASTSAIRALRGLDRRLLLGAVEPEERLARGDALVDVDEGLGHPAVGLGQDGDGAEHRDGARGRGVEVEDRGDQRDRQDHAEGDAPAQLVPDREEGDLAADALALGEAAVEEVRQDGERRAEQELEHVRPPCRRRGGGGVRSPRGRREEVVPAARGGPALRSRPESFSSESAIEFIGVEKSGSSTSASSSAAIQKTCVVGEEREQREHRDELQLHLVGAVRHVLGQRVELAGRSGRPRRRRRAGRPPSPSSASPTGRGR